MYPRQASAAVRETESRSGLLAVAGQLGRFFLPSKGHKNATGPRYSGSSSSSSARN
jgi:hypothetical protein